MFFLEQYVEIDGIRTKIEKPGVYFVATKNKILGIYGTNVQYALSNWSECIEKAEDDLAKGYSISIKTGQMSNYDFQNQWQNCYFKENYEYSTSSKTTYVRMKRLVESCTTYPFITNYWGGETIDNWCYTLSNDYSQLIYWSFNNKKRTYYKHITREDLRPNTDFLYE